MNGLEMGLKLLSLVLRLTPPEKHPPADYSEFRNAFSEYAKEHMAILDSSRKIGEGFEAKQVEVPAQVVEIPEPEPALALPEPKKAVATSCIACSRSHLATIAGALDESLRFAREGGLTDPEAIRRIDTAEREVTMMERIDLSPEAIQNSPPKEQEMARGFLPKIRKLRQDIGQIASVEQLEQAAAESSILTHEFRLRQMELAGANLNPIIALAKAVEKGEISMEEARIKVKEYLPAEA